METKATFITDNKRLLEQPNGKQSAVSTYQDKLRTSLLLRHVEVTDFKHNNVCLLSQDNLEKKAMLPTVPVSDVGCGLTSSNNGLYEDNFIVQGGRKQ